MFLFYFLLFGLYNIYFSIIIAIIIIIDYYQIINKFKKKKKNLNTNRHNGH